MAYYEYLYLLAYYEYPLNRFIDVYRSIKIYFIYQIIFCKFKSINNIKVLRMTIKRSKFEYDKERTEWNIYFKVKSSRVWNKSDGTIRRGIVTR